MQYLLSFAIRVVRFVFEYFWLITAFLIVSTVIGWHQYLSTHPFNNFAANQHTVWDTIVLTIMIAPMRGPLLFGPDVPLLLNLGRVLLPFMFVGGIFKATVLRTATEKIVVKWFARSFSQHAVVCGLSQAGFALVCELLQRDRWVVLIDPKGPPVLLSRLQQALATMGPAKRSRFALIEGDATSTEVLEMAGAPHAKEIYAVSDDDYVNLDIATAAKALTSASGNEASGLQIHVHFKDYLMRDPLKDNFKLFDSRILAGRQVVSHYPADAPWLAARDFSKAPHAILIGLGSLGEQVVLQLARTAHYACAQRMNVTIVDTKAVELSNSFLHRYPMLDSSVAPARFGMPDDAGNRMILPILNLHFVQTSVDDFCDAGFAEVCVRSGIPGAIYVCLANDIETDRIGKGLAIALERTIHEAGVAIVARPKCTIVKSMRRFTQANKTRGRPVTEERVDANVELVEMDVLRTAAAAVVTADLEHIAERTHNEYIAYSKKKSIETSDKPWQALDDEARQMNYNTTDHHLVRLREMGLNITGKDLENGRFKDKPVQADCDRAKQYLSGHLEEFANAEHRRWACDKLFFGWRYSNVKNDFAKVNKWLLGYENLTDEIKQYDRDNVKRALFFIENP